MPLTAQKQLFADTYLKLNDGRKGVGAEAARIAGYSERAAAQQASRLLKDADVITYMQSRVSPVMSTAPNIVGGKMEADEVLQRLTDIARSDVMAFHRVNDDGEPVIDLRRADGSPVPTQLIKRMRTRKKTRTIKDVTEHEVEHEVEMYDAQSALVTLGKHWKLWDRAGETDWKEEVKKLGLSPAELFEQMVRDAATKIKQSRDA